MNASHVSEEARLALVELEASKRDANEEVEVLRKELEQMRRRLEDAEDKVEMLETQVR